MNYKLLALDLDGIVCPDPKPSARWRLVEVDAGDSETIGLGHGLNVGKDRVDNFLNLLRVKAKLEACIDRADSHRECCVAHTISTKTEGRMLSWFVAYRYKSFVAVVVFCSVSHAEEVGNRMGQGESLLPSACYS